MNQPLTPNPQPLPLCHCQPARFPHSCPCLNIILTSPEAATIAAGRELIMHGRPIPYNRDRTLAVWIRAEHPETSSADNPERSAELRYANAHRCEHRSIEPLREEPCACPVIGLQPIYRCELLQIECADLRRPQAPAIFCGSCSSRSN